MASKETYTTGKDHGKEPYVVNIEKMTVDNKNFRKTLWTGEHLQLTVMSVDVGDDIGLEVHPSNDQFVRIEQGKGRTEMGPKKDDLNYTKDVAADDIIMVPAGTWHNVTNTGDEPLKVYVLYGPADHEPGTVHPEHKDAEKDPNEE